MAAVIFQTNGKGDIMEWLLWLAFTYGCLVLFMLAIGKKETPKP
jgi:hypothetical protein